MNIAPRNGKYEEVICIKSKEIIHIDWGNVEIIEGKIYKSCTTGTGFLKENLSKKNDDILLIELGGMLWPFPKNCFSTIIEERDRKINDILDGR